MQIKLFQWLEGHLLILLTKVFGIVFAGIGIVGAIIAIVIIAKSKTFNKK